MRPALISLMMMPLAVGCGGDDRRKPAAAQHTHGSADSADDGSDTPIVDTDSDGVEATLDCDDDDPQLGAIEDDNDCDGVVAAADCDDTSADLGSVWDDGDCDGIAEAQDAYGRQCDSYTYDPSLCGENNDADFNSLSMCCACGGGSTSPVEGDICYAGEWDGAATVPLAPGSEVTIRYRAEGPE